MTFTFTTTANQDEELQDKVDFINANRPEGSPTITVQEFVEKNFVDFVKAHIQENRARRAERIRVVYLTGTKAVRQAIDNAAP